MLMIERGGDSGGELRWAAAVAELEQSVEVEAAVARQEPREGAVEASRAKPLSPPGDDRIRRGL
ncbi:MAG: hypothetical protein M3133_04695 [Actinomycetota bacterium]|nr:hypothetical protein [Actinomycetota bacterium]